MSKPVLYNYFRSSASWRVRIALAYKGIDYEYKTISLTKKEQCDPEFLKINPMAQIPVFQHDGNFISQSMAILEYIEEVFTEHPLLPKDPASRAKVRQICEIIGSGIQPLQNPTVCAKIDDKGWASFWINKGFIALEKILEQTSGLCCVGDEITLADCFLIPQVYNAFRFNADMDMKPFPIISRINNRLVQLEPFKRAHAHAQIDCPEDMGGQLA